MEIILSGKEIRKIMEDVEKSRKEYMKRLKSRLKKSPINFEPMKRVSKREFTEIIISLILQSCCFEDEETGSWICHHNFISAYEEAFDFLEDMGILKEIKRGRRKGYYKLIYDSDDFWNAYGLAGVNEC